MSGRGGALHASPCGGSGGNHRPPPAPCLSIQVKLLKCLVDNIVVDISFNQLGGLCTLNFLEEVDQLVGQNNLFKRAVILVRLQHA